MCRHSVSVGMTPHPALSRHLLLEGEGFLIRKTYSLNEFPPRNKAIADWRLMKCSHVSLECRLIQSFI